MAEARCPICSHPVAEDIGSRLRPFCSRRCADVDLGRWFTGGYRVPSTETDEDEASSPE